jgi:hypothetical protein
MMSSNKDLQKFTDFEQIKTKDDFLNLMKTDPEEIPNVLKWIVKKMNEGLIADEPEEDSLDKYYERFEQFKEIVKPEQIEEIRRTRWQVNKYRIENIIHDSIMNLNRLPTQNEIHQRSGLSRVTINKHLKEGLSSTMQRSELDKYKMMTGNVLNRLYKIGINDNNLQALKIYLDYFKHSSSMQTIKQTNYLQINNTRIDEVTVNQLPEDAILQIESIIKTSIPIKKNVGF